MKKNNRAVCGTIAVIGVFVAFAGLVLCMCETPEVADQFRNMFTGMILIAGGSVMAYKGGAARWTEETYG